MLKEFRNTMTIHSQRVFETTIAADINMKVITGVKKSRLYFICHEREILFIKDTLKARISSNLNKLHAKNARKRNGYARHCGKIPVHYGQKPRCIMGRNKKFLFLYSFGLTPCSLAWQLLGIEKNCAYMLDHPVSMATLSLTS